MRTHGLSIFNGLEGTLLQRAGAEMWEVQLTNVPGLGWFVMNIPQRYLALSAAPAGDCREPMGKGTHSQAAKYDLQAPEVVGGISAGLASALVCRGNVLLGLGGGVLIAASVTLWLRSHRAASQHENEVWVLPGTGISLVDCVAAKTVSARLDEEEFYRRMFNNKFLSFRGFYGNQSWFHGHHVYTTVNSTHGVFVEREPSGDNLFDVARFPFFHEAEAARARQLYLVPIKMLYRVAERLRNDKFAGHNPRVFLLPSTGRCGSTLMANLVDLHPDVVCLSEPQDLRITKMYACQRHSTGSMCAEAFIFQATAAAGLVQMLLASAWSERISRSLAESLLYSSTALAFAGLAGGSVLLASDWSERREAPRQLRAAMTLWFKDLLPNQVGCWKPQSCVSSMLLLHNGKILREAGFLGKEAVATGSNGAAHWEFGDRKLSAGMKVVFMYRGLLPSLRSWMRIEDGHEGNSNVARIVGAIRQVNLETLQYCRRKASTDLEMISLLYSFPLSPPFSPLAGCCLTHEPSSSTTWRNVYERSWDVSCCTPSNACWARSHIASQILASSPAAPCGQRGQCAMEW